MIFDRKADDLIKGDRFFFRPRQRKPRTVSKVIKFVYDGAPIVLIILEYPACAQLSLSPDHAVAIWNR